MKSRNIAESGIITALILVILYCGTLIPVSTISILTLASCLIPICIIRTSLKNAVLAYIASSILSFFIVPLNIFLMYVFLFGIYGIIKAFIEKLNNRILEIILKLSSFNILLFILYSLASSMINDLNLNMPLYLIWIGSQFVFLIYDYALTLIISYYFKRLHNKI